MGSTIRIPNNSNYLGQLWFSPLSWSQFFQSYKITCGITRKSIRNHQFLLCKECWLIMMRIESLFVRVWILSSMEFAKLALSLRKFELFYYYYYYVYIFHINHYSESKHYIPTTLYFQIHKVFLVFINKYTFLYLSVTNDGFFLSHVCLSKQEIFIPTL